MYVNWRRYLGAMKVASGSIHPPQLAHPGAAGVYFTDRESLDGINAATDFVQRAGLSRSAQNETLLYGCTVIGFSTTHLTTQLPPPAAGARQGLTVGGAREWITVGNVEMDRSIDVWYCDWDTNGQSRSLFVPL